VPARSQKNVLRQPRKKSRANHRRLSRSGRAEHRDELLPLHTGEEIVDKALPAEEPGRILSTIGGQPDIGRLAVILRLGDNGRVEFGRERVPPPLPQFDVDVAVARADVGERDLQAREPAPARGLGERRRGVAAALPELAVGRTTRVLTKTPQVNGELDKSRPIELQRSLRSDSRCPVRRSPAPDNTTTLYTSGSGFDGHQLGVSSKPVRALRPTGSGGEAPFWGRGLRLLWTPKGDLGHIRGTERLRTAKAEM
jgi:hypothetical protein